MCIGIVNVVPASENGTEEVMSAMNQHTAALNAKGGDVVNMGLSLPSTLASKLSKQHRIATAPITSCAKDHFLRISSVWLSLFASMSAAQLAVARRTGRFVTVNQLCFAATRTLILLALLMSATKHIEAAPLSPTNEAWNINRNPTSSDPVAYYGEWPGHEYTPSPDDWRGVGMYQLLVDRYVDGDPRNNGDSRAYNPFDLAARHGGDFRGIERKLSYIKSLGFDAVWIGAIMQTVDELNDTTYHNYGPIDVTLIDRRFGTLTDLRSLVTAAHSLGMYVVIDLVVNHVAALYEWDRSGRDDRVPNTRRRYESLDGELPLTRRDGVSSSFADLKVNNTPDHTCTYADVFAAGDRRVQEPNRGEYCSSDLYHNGQADFAASAGDLDPWNSKYGSLPGFLNLRLESNRMQEVMTAMIRALLASTDIDAIRLDVAHQVPISFMKAWIPALRQAAAELNKTNFLLIAEHVVSVCPNCFSPRVFVGRGFEFSTTDDTYKFSVDNTTVVWDGCQDFAMLRATGEGDPVLGHGADIWEVFKRQRYTYDHWRPNASHKYSMMTMFNLHDSNLVSSKLQSFRIGQVYV